MSSQRTDYPFHVWHRDPKTGLRKWCGQFLDDKSAITWKKRQENPSEYTINNIGPNAMYKASPEGQAKAQADREAAARRRAEQQARYERIRNGEVEKVDRPATIDKRAVAGPPRVARIPRYMPKPKPAPVPDTPEQKRLKADAAKVLERHKRDEKKDLDQGINR